MLHGILHGGVACVVVPLLTVSDISPPLYIRATTLWRRGGIRHGGVGVIVAPRIS